MRQRTAKQRASDKAPDAEVEIDGTFSCDHCEKVFPTAQGRACHQWRAHGIKSVLRNFISGSICPVCEKNCGTRIRALQHVSRSSCAQHAKQCEAIDPNIVAALDATDALRTKAARAKGISPFAWIG